MDIRYPSEKVCSGCDIVKGKSSFNFQHANKDGLNKHCKECLAAGNRKKNQKPRRIPTPAENRKMNLKRKFGITPEEFDQMLFDQGGGCAICGDDDPAPARGAGTSLFVVDHCHDTGVVRSLLCSGCNKAIGFLKDDPTIAKNASEYLKKWMVTNYEY